MILFINNVHGRRRERTRFFSNKYNNIEKTISSIHRFFVYSPPNKKEFPQKKRPMKRFNDFFRCMSPLVLFMLFFSTNGASAMKSNGPAADDHDSIRISLLTCAPGEEIYSLFGHTAIRYENPSQGIDVVFNYGLFSFNTPNFILRFSLGETDYQLGATDYAHFAAEYAFFGRSVWQQTLNLTEREKAELIRLLQENYRPENRVYRYNFFHDNCATRPRDSKT